VHACSELGSLHSNAPQTNSSTIGLESNVTAVKAMYPSHKVVAIVGSGKCLLFYSKFAGSCIVKCAEGSTRTNSSMSMTVKPQTGYLIDNLKLQHCILNTSCVHTNRWHG
jgi:hypothetical protein